MKDFENGWSGLRAYAASCGVCEVHDSDDVAAEKIKAVIQGTRAEDEDPNPSDQSVPSSEDDGPGPVVLGGPGS